MIIMKMFSFDMAHMLDGHDGKCNNLHGHTYHMKVYIKGKVFLEGSKEGMVEDYHEVKCMVQKYILAYMDHSFIYNKDNKMENSIAEILNKNGRKIYKMKKRTTAENISEEIYNVLKTKINGFYQIELFETLTSSVIYGE